MIERHRETEEKEGVDGIIRQEQAEKSSLSQSRCRREPRREQRSLPPSFLSSSTFPASSSFLFFFLHSPWSQKTKLNYKLWICPWDLTLALLHLSLKEEEEGARMSALINNPPVVQFMWSDGPSGAPVRIPACRRVFGIQRNGSTWRLAVAVWQTKLPFFVFSSLFLKLHKPVWENVV